MINRKIIGGSNGKYETRNPISRYLISAFDNSILDCLLACKPKAVLEIGCGEGHITELILKTNASHIFATDICQELVEDNKRRIKDKRVTFQNADLMSLKLTKSYDTVVCCEVLEHLGNPMGGLKALYEFKAKQYVISVPREPIWRILNFLRGAYIKDFGNSPGHLNHWSRKSFLDFIQTHFKVISIYQPLPWTVIHCVPK